jgi:hypothetical protein
MSVGLRLDCSTGPLVVPTGFVVGSGFSGGKGAGVASNRCVHDTARQNCIRSSTRQGSRDGDFVRHAACDWRELKGSRSGIEFQAHLT